MLEKIADNVYTISKPFKIAGLPLGVKSTVLVLKDGRVLLHSPVALSKEEVAEIQALGQVSFVVAPNLLHHLFLSEAVEHFPKATVLFASGLDKKKADFSFQNARVLDFETFKDLGLGEELEMIPIAGMPKMNEVVLYHKKSRTLLVTDLMFNLQGIKGFLPRLMCKTFGTLNKPAVSRMFLSMVKNKPAFAESIKDVKNLQFNHIVMAHGQSIQGNGQEIFSGVFAKWL